MKRYGISIVGAGRLGRSLGRRLREKGWWIHSVVTRSQATARRAVRSIGGGRAHGEITRGVFAAPVILIAVPDDVIPLIVRQLAAFGGEELCQRVILHTSGALSSDLLSPLRSLGARVGSVHPLQTFSGIGAPALDGCVFAIEGDPGAIAVSRAIARALDGQVILLPGSAKAAYHAAASISAGLVLSLLEAAVQIFASLGMKRREALRALLPLTRQVLENDESLGARAAWTGPLARGDYGVIVSHENALRSFPEEYLAAYRALNQLSARVLAHDPEPVLKALADLSHLSAHSKARGATA